MAHADTVHSTSIQRSAVQELEEILGPNGRIAQARLAIQPAKTTYQMSQVLMMTRIVRLQVPARNRNTDSTTALGLINSVKVYQ
jgi:hypothetical protein